MAGHITKKAIIIFFVFSFLFSIKGKCEEKRNNLNSDYTYYKKFLTSHKNGRWEDAKKYGEILIKNFPNSPFCRPAYLYIGLYYKARHDFDKSIAYYQKLIENFGEDEYTAEAYARIGCDYYRLNNFRKAYQYFKLAGEKAKNWKQRKYASTWGKWVRFALAREKSVVFNCATKSLKHYLKIQKIPISEKNIYTRLKPENGLLSLYQIVEEFKKEGVKLNVFKVSFDEISKLPDNFVAVVKPSHLIVIEKITKD